jgi:NAD+ kinase
MLSQVSETDARRCVAVITHMGRPQAVEAASRLVGGLLDAGIEVAVPAEDRGVLSSRLTRPLSQLEQPGVDGQKAPYELMVVLGGDGTILRSAEWVITSDVALLGVNLGHVGFLAEAESSEIDSIVRQIVDCSYAVEERFTVDVSLRDEDEVVWTSYAINEVSIEKAARERMLEIVVEVDGRPLSRWACDGLLVATPTGSTAYAFSAGGPVIWPGVDAFLLVPLSAHALFARPLVLGPSSRVVVELVDASPTFGLVTCDGRRSTQLRTGMAIEVVRGRHRLRLARLSESPFTDRLVRKFGLRVEGWRGLAELEKPPDDLPASALSGPTH